MTEVELSRQASDLRRQAELIADEFLGGWEAAEPAVRRFRELLRPAAASPSAIAAPLDPGDST